MSNIKKIYYYVLYNPIRDRILGTFDNFYLKIVSISKCTLKVSMHLFITTSMEIRFLTIHCTYIE